MTAAPPTRHEVFLDFGTGRSVHCVTAGAGPEVVFFPANGGNVADMDPLIDRIAERHRFVGIDAPGRVPTLWPDEPFHFFDDLPGVYDRALRELNVGRHVALGHSMGGMYALHHARRNRASVRALVLFEGFVTLPIHYATGSPSLSEPVRMPPDVARDFRRRFALNEKWQDDRPRFKETFWPSQQAHDARPFVAQLDLPILVVIGEHGRPLPTTLDAWRRQLGMEGVEDLEVLVIPRASHWMMLEAPDEVWAGLQPFLNRVSG